MNPTMHLRFIERDIVVERREDAAISRKVKILQQFHEHTSGKDVAGDSFIQIYGTWVDVRTEAE